MLKVHSLSIRNRILCQAFAKAMRDNFVHCRIAGLKAAGACLSLFDVNQYAAILLPQVCTLLVDRNSEIRQLSMSLMEESQDIFKKNHEFLLQQKAEDALRDEKGSSTKDSQSSATVWTSWAVEGLSKTIERVSRDAVGGQTPDAAKDYSFSVSANQSSDSIDKLGKEKPPALAAEPSSSRMLFNDDEDDSSKAPEPSNWDDDDDWDENIDEDIKIVDPKPASTSFKMKSEIIKVESTPTKEPPKSSSTLSLKTAKPKVTKLAATKLTGDAWDDF